MQNSGAVIETMSVDKHLERVSVKELKKSLRLGSD
jgi:hypothetical protein